MVLVAFQRRIVYALYLIVSFEELCNCQSILAVLLHTERKCLQTEIEVESRLSGRIASEISHKLHSCLYDVCGFAVSLCVDSAVIAFVRLGKLRELAVCPVEITAVNNNASALNCVTVHILCCGVNNDISAELERSAKYRCRECIIDDERNTVLVCDLCELLNVEDAQCRICESFTENSLCVRLECFLYLLLGSVGINENALDAQLFESESEKVDSSAVDSSGRDEAVACL